MADREKVVKEYEDFVKSFSKRDDTYYKSLFNSVLVLLKEQEAVNWTKCTDRIPNKDGEYLVVKSIIGMFNKIDVCAFALNLHEIDEFDFPDEERPGWYEHDSETGYFEWTGITHWAELPTMPDGIVEGR